MKLKVNEPTYQNLLDALIDEFIWQLCLDMMDDEEFEQFENKLRINLDSALQESIIEVTDDRV